jgi:uncharacterized protein (UPF0332 family)
MDKAHRVLAAARHLRDHGFFDDAVSRAYYAVFHAAAALLASIGRSARTHEGLRAAVGQHFIRPGLLDARFARVLAHTAADRNDADYGAVTSFTGADADETLAHAEAFVEAAGRLVAVPPAT